MLIFYFLPFFIMNSTLSMEEIDSSPFDEFLVKHDNVLVTAEGKNAFCNFIDLVSSDLYFYDQFVQTSKHAYTKLTSSDEEIIFTPIIQFRKDITQSALVRLPREKVEIVNQLEYSHILRISYVSPQIFYATLYIMQKVNNTKDPNYVYTLKKILESDLIASLSNTPAEVMLCQNLILLLFFNIFKQEKFNSFPYFCGCADTHFNHLKNVCLQSVCIGKTPSLFNLSSKSKFYQKDTLNMMTDLLDLLPFYDNLRVFCKTTLVDFVGGLVKSSYKKSLCKKVIEEYEQIEAKIDPTLLSSLQAYYRKLYVRFDVKERRRSPLIFGYLKDLHQISFTDPNNIFSNFIEKIENPEPHISVEYSQQERAINNLLEEYYTEKKDSKNHKNRQRRTLPIKPIHTKNDLKKHREKKHEIPKKRGIEKNHEIIPFTAAISPEYSLKLKNVLETKLKETPIRYDKDYLHNCLAANEDDYHDFPWALDRLVMEYGVQRSEPKDRCAVVCYWPITYTSNDTLEKYAVYRIVFDKKTEVIFHRGPVLLQNENKLRKLRSDPEYFNKILNNALPAECVFAQKEPSKNFLENTGEWFTNNNDHVTIKDLFNGPYGCKITEVTQRYIIINSLSNQKTIMFPLMM